jgi:hypothetical protein
VKYLKNINELISEKFESDQEFDDLLNYLLNNFFSHEKVDLLEEVIENSIISLDFMKLNRISFSHAGFVLGSTSMSASRDLNPAIISDIKSASELRGSQYWDRINGWSHLFSSAKDMIIRGAKPYYQYGVDFNIDSGYNGMSQNDLIRLLGHFSYTDDARMIRSLIIKTIEKELAFEGLNVKISLGNSYPSFGRAFVSDVRITDLDYVYKPDLLKKN